MAAPHFEKWIDVEENIFPIDGSTNLLKRNWCWRKKLILPMNGSTTLWKNKFNKLKRIKQFLVSEGKTRIKK